jgi:hypothetical protein
MLFSMPFLKLKDWFVLTIKRQPTVAFKTKICDIRNIVDT